MMSGICVQIIEGGGDGNRGEGKIEMRRDCPCVDNLTDGSCMMVITGSLYHSLYF